MALSVLTLKPRTALTPRIRLKQKATKVVTPQKTSYFICITPYICMQRSLNFSMFNAKLKKKQNMPHESTVFLIAYMVFIPSECGTCLDMQGFLNWGSLFKF